MLDLQAGVELEEPDVLALDEELDGAEALVADVLPDPDRVLVEPPSHGGIEERRGRDLDQLLVAALDRAVPFAEVAHPGAVSDDLHLDVPGRTEQSLDVHLAGVGLGPAAGVRLRQVGGVGDLTHAASAAAGQPLDHHGAVLGQERGGLRRGGGAECAGEHRDAGVGRRGAGADLVPEQVQQLGTGADEDQTLRRAAPRERGVLAEEAVAGMDELGACAPRDLDQRVLVQVPGDLVRLVGERDVRCRRVLRGVHGDGPQPLLAGGPDEPDGDLAPVGDEQGHEASRTCGGPRLYPRTREPVKRSFSSPHHPVSGTSRWSD
nr:hypothetical protein [Pseudonocardia oroxyli]